MDTFGDDILQRVFSRMPVTCLGCSSSVCWHWHHLIEGNPELWEGAYLRMQSAPNSPAGPNDLERFQPGDPSKQNRRDLVNKWKSCAVSKEQRLRFADGTVSLQRWKGHSGRVTCCGMLMDRVATGSSDRTVRIWSLESLKSLEEYTAPCGGSIVDLNFNETRLVAATGSEVFIWSRDDKGRLLRRMSSPNQRFHSLSVADPELVVGCGDGTSRVFDMYGGRCSRIFRQHTGAVTCLGSDNSSPQLLASGSDNGKVVVCNLFDGQQVAAMTPDTSRAGISCLHMAASGCFLFCGTTSGIAHCWDLRNKKELWSTRISPTQVTCMHQETYGSSVLVAGGLDGVLRVLDSETGELLQSYKRTQFDDPIRLATTKSTERASCPMQDTGHHGANIHASYHPRDKDSANEPLVTRRELQSCAPVLSVKMGFMHAVTTHTDGTVTLWRFDL